MADKKKIKGSTKPAVPRQIKSPVPKLTKLDRKREKIKDAFEKGEIRDFPDIFDVYLQETPFARLIGMQKKQLAPKLENVDKFNFKDITRISQAFDIDFDRVVQFIAALVKAQHAQTAARHKTK
jgi:hypothetical protein